MIQNFSFFNLQKSKFAEEIRDNVSTICLLSKINKKTLSCKKINISRGRAVGSSSGS